MGAWAKENRLTLQRWTALHAVASEALYEERGGRHLERFARGKLHQEKWRLGRAVIVHGIVGD